jgi:hypothetical protein
MIVLNTMFKLVSFFCINTVMAGSIATPYGANVRAWKETSLMPVVKGALLHEIKVNLGYDF